MRGFSKNLGLMGNIAVLLVICSCYLPAQAKYSGGSGSPEYPYLIYTAEQMNAIGANPNYWDKHFKLMANVDLGQFKGEEFNIIGYYGSYPNNKPFTGVFDGNGHTISNFNYNSTDSDEIGIFGYVYGRNAEIKNLVLINPNVDAGTGGYVGSLVGYLRDGTITNSYAEGGRISGEDYVGGLVGYNSHGTVTDCDATSSVSGDRCIGGLVGVNYHGTITNCYSTCSVSGYLYIGGLVGFNSRGTIANSYSSGPISGNAHVGGLVGDNYGTISKCFATGNVSGQYSVGGLVGYQSNGTVKNSYATGSASGIRRVGGLISDNHYGTISNCYSTGHVFGKDYVGGMVGRDSDSIIMASFWDRETSGQWSSDAGEAKTTSEMKDPNTFIGWGSCDDEVVWILDDGNDYPRLAWEGKPGQPLGMQQLSDLLTGNGTEIDPYIIRTGVELQLIGLFPCEWDKNFILDNDVNLAAYTGMQFNIIGNRNNPFNGIFNGRGHRIWNFSWRSLISGDYIGLFARVGSGGTIRNLGMENVSIVTEGRTNYIGGLVGLNEGTVVSCYSTGSIWGDWYIGGLVGYNKGTIANCYAIGSTSGHTHIGGLVGMNYEGIISGCYAEGSISGHVRIGGLAGTNQGAISNSYATCSVYCYGTSGGLVGNNSDGTISRCYATGEITGNEWGSDIGGLVGDYDNSAVTASFWDIETSGQTWSNGGTGKTTAEMQMASTFYAWACIDDFAWTIDEGNDYPRLWWENKPGELITTPSYGGGSGEPNDPYLIYTAEQLNVIGLTPCHHGKYFKLMADIYLSDFTGTSFNIIGYFVDLYSPDNKPFTGVFDGNGHTISNFTYTSTGTNYIGLFGYVSGQIKDLGLINPNVHAGTGNSVGSLVGRVSGGTITNCYVEGGSVDGYSRVGGLVGINYHGMITNCYSTGIVSGYSAVGGLVGYDYYSTIANCYSTGSVSGNKNVGGLVGFNHNGTILNCYSGGSVVGDMNVGGLVGWSCGSVSNCYSTSYVSGIDDVGGLVGYNEAGKVIASFWDIGTSGQSTSAGGTGLPTVEMQIMSTFTDAGWDFVGETVNGIEDIWFIPQWDYPHLWWEGMQVLMKLTPSKLNCRSKGNWIKAHLTMPEGFTVADVDSNRPAVLHSFGFESTPLYVFVNDNGLVEIEAAFERGAVCSLAGDWPQELTVAGFLADGNIFLGKSKVRIIHPGMNVIEKLAWYWLNVDCVQPGFCEETDMNEDSEVNLLDYALLLNSQVEFINE